MNYRSLHIAFLVSIGVLFSARSQQQSSAVDWEAYGYLNGVFSGISQESQYQGMDYLLHHRLNIDGYFNDELSVHAGIRNRLLWGYSLANIPNFSSYIKQDGMDIALGGLWIDSNKLVGHSVFDRLNLELETDKWHIVLGRQRVNWGTNLVWNPNDLFNAFNYFDFNYPERPGVDALRIQYYLSGDASLELVSSYDELKNQRISAVRYATHIGQYDFQLIGADYKDYLSMGMGWEGSIYNFGFKGEMSYFAPVFFDSLECSSRPEQDIFQFSLSFDYYFKNGWYVLFSNLFNSQGVSNAEVDASLFSNTSIDVTKLMPNKNTYLMQLSKPINAQFSASLTTFYARELKAYFSMPQLSWSLSQNWDLNLIGQLYYSKATTDLSVSSSNVFVQLGYSY